jgi:hypothetical protein
MSKVIKQIYKAVRSSETSTNFYQISGRHFPEYRTVFFMVIGVKSLSLIHSHNGLLIYDTL